MGKIHELLAIEAQIKSTADVVLNETIAVFSNKKEHFQGQTRVYEPRNDEGETFPPENKPLVTTVKAKLDHTEEHMTRLIDIIYQKESANQLAKADITINGTILAKDVPATFLLQMEGRLRTLKQMYLAAPTLEPDEEWTSDIKTENTWVSPVHQTSKQAKIVKPIEISPATEKHPAQAQLITVDETIGYWKTKKISGKITPVEKARLLANIDALSEAVIKARSRANQEDAPSINIAGAMFNFINTGAVGQSMSSPPNQPQS